MKDHKSIKIVRLLNREGISCEDLQCKSRRNFLINSLRSSGGAVASYKLGLISSLLGLTPVGMTAEATPTTPFSMWQKKPIAPINYTYIGYAEGNASNSSSETFSTVGIGTAAADRLVVVGIGATGNAGGNRTITSITCNAVGMNLVASSANPRCAAIGYLIVPTGTTANFVVNYSGSTGIYESLAVATLTNYQSSTPHDTDTGAQGSGLTDVSTITIPADGVAIYYANTHQSTSLTWSSATSDMSYSPAAVVAYHSFAHKTSPTLLTDHSETITYQASSWSSYAAVTFR
jgi:hypothetical protein